MTGSPRPPPASRPAVAADPVRAPARGVKTRPRPARPPLYRVILVNDDFTPREFVVTVLAAEFRLGPGEAHAVMMTAHRKGSCVVSVYPRDVAETKAGRATEMGRRAGFPLLFTTEPET
jgi:ATP-dependent Clp protease adaptor protein ClpS